MCGARMQEIYLSLQRRRVPLVDGGYATPKGELTRSITPRRARLTKSEPQLVIDSSGSLMAQFHPISLFKREKAYLEVTPAGMDMLDHIIVTFIPVDVDRRKG